MKKITLLLIVCYATIANAQVPSINFHSYSNGTPEVNDLIKKEKKLKKEISEIKKNKESESSFFGANDSLEEKKDSLKKLIIKKENLLKKDYQYQYNLKYYDSKLKSTTDKINKLKKDLLDASNDENRNRITKYQNEIQSLKNDSLKLTIERDRKLNPKENNYSWMLPSFNEKYRNAFFEDTYGNSIDKTNFLNAFSISGNPNGVVGQSELVADNIRMFRITFGTVITASNDSLSNENTKVEALQRLINGGGNFYIDLALPLMTSIKGNNDDLMNGYFYANIKVASDLKGFGNDIDASTYNSSLGMNFYGDVSSENRKFNFFCVANANYYWLSTKEFYQNLAINHDHGFLSGKITLGVTLLGQFRVSANVLTFGSEDSLRRSKMTVGLQFLPK